MLTAYGSEINGLISSILQFISYFNLVEAGLSSAAVYSLYKPIAEKDYNRINRIVVAAKHFYVKSGFIFVGLVVILAICYPFITDSTVLDQTSIFVLVLVLGVNGSLLFSLTTSATMKKRLVLRHECVRHYIFQMHYKVPQRMMS